MQNLQIESTDTTPKIVIDYDNDEFLIEGISIPILPEKFYVQIIDNLKTNLIMYLETKSKDVFTLQMNIDFFNSNSQKMIFELLVELNNLSKLAAKKVVVNWNVDMNDEDLLEQIDTLNQISELKINKIFI